MRQQREKLSQSFREPAASSEQAVSGRPIITAEDRAEQLLIEYQDTPNPELMLYFYESSPNIWLCPCGRRNRPEEAYCGHCGVSRRWLDEHTSDEYLAGKIIERKGEAAVKWQPSSSADFFGEEEGSDGVRPASADVEIRRINFAETRLEDFFGSRFRRLWLYMVRFGTTRRRVLTAAVIGVTVILLAVLLLHAAN